MRAIAAVALVAAAATASAASAAGGQRGGTLRLLSFYWLVDQSWVQ